LYLRERCQAGQALLQPSRDEYDTEGKNGPSRCAFRVRQKLSRSKDHFLHVLATHIVENCIAIGELSEIRDREDENDNCESRNWGKRGNNNKKLHEWEFNRFITLLEHKTEEYGILVDRVSERDMSKTCSCYGRKRDANRNIPTVGNPRRLLYCGEDIKNVTAISRQEIPLTEANINCKSVGYYDHLEVDSNAFIDAKFNDRIKSFTKPLNCFLFMNLF
jgi:transposase